MSGSLVELVLLVCSVVLIIVISLSVWVSAISASGQERSTGCDQKENANEYQSQDWVHVDFYINNLIMLCLKKIHLIYVVYIKIIFCSFIPSHQNSNSMSIFHEIRLIISLLLIKKFKFGITDPWLILLVRSMDYVY